MFENGEQELEKEKVEGLSVGGRHRNRRTHRYVTTDKLESLLDDKPWESEPTPAHAGTDDATRHHRDGQKFGAFMLSKLCPNYAVGDFDACLKVPFPNLVYNSKD